MNAWQPKPSQDTQTNNKQVIHLAPFELTQEKAHAIFDREYNFLDGPKGLARFVNNHVLKTEKGKQSSTIYACFDASRCVFK